MNQTNRINAASYDAPSNTLIVCDVADNLGDHKALVEGFPPGKQSSVRDLIQGVADGGPAAGAIEALLTVPTVVPTVIRVMA